MVKEDVDKNMLKKKFVMQVATRNYLDEIWHEFLGTFTKTTTEPLTNDQDYGSDPDSDARSYDSSFSHTNMNR